MTFMPNSGELKVFCDEQQVIADRINRYASLPVPERLALPAPERGPPLPGHRANTLVPPHAPQYAAMLARAQDPNSDPLDFKCDNQGLWVDYRWLIDMPKRNVGLEAITRRMAAE